MKTVYILTYGTEHGNREDCSIFYNPFEVFDDREKFIERRREIRRAQKKGGDNTAYTFAQAVELNRPLAYDAEMDTWISEGGGEETVDPALEHDEEFDQAFP